MRGGGGVDSGGPSDVSPAVEESGLGRTETDRRRRTRRGTVLACSESLGESARFLASQQGGGREVVFWRTYQMQSRACTYVC